MVMLISFLLQQRDQEEVPDEGAEDSQRRDDHAPEVEMERDPVPDISPPLLASFTAPADTPDPSYTTQHSPEYVHVNTRELAGVMDAICSLASTHASMDQRLTRAETTLEQCHTMLQQIMSHLGLPHVPDHRDEPTAAVAASLDMLATAAAASNPPPPRD